MGGPAEGHIAGIHTWMEASGQDGNGTCVTVRIGCGMGSAPDIGSPAMSVNKKALTGTNKTTSLTVSDT